MKQLIIITGDLAAMKSTLSKKIGNDLNIVCLNKDDIKEILGDSIGYQNREENLKLSYATFELMFYFMH
jgi:predicted kinase